MYYFKFLASSGTRNLLKWVVAVAVCFSIFGQSLHAQRVIDFTMDSAIEIAMRNSYDVRQLELSIDRSNKWLEAERAGLKSRFYMNLVFPELEAVSDYQYDSNLQRRVLVRENTQLFQANVSIRQPVILFGYPTNGYLSLNNRMYRYTQRDGENNTRYYNRYFISFDQPLFQPNRLKFDLEEAQIDLEEQELDYLQDLMRLTQRTVSRYYDLFELSYETALYSNYIEGLEEAEGIVKALVAEDSSRAIELTQVQVELTNAREQLAQNQSDLRLEKSQTKQQLRLSVDDSLVIEPEISLTPITVDREQAIEYGYNLHPSLRLQELDRRGEEIDLINTKGQNSLRLDLEMTYGLEKSDEHYYNLWEDQETSYTLGLNAYIPIWDWGQRRARIEAREISLEKRELYIEEEMAQIETQITNDILNLQEYQRRALSMQENLQRAREISVVSLEQYQDGAISIRDLLQSLERELDTSDNFLQAYLGYRESLMDLIRDTFYDYENGMSMVERFNIAQE